MFKNTASKFIVFAFDATTNLPKGGDAANITAYVSIDNGAVTVLGDTSATEMDATNATGYYLFDAAQAETNGDKLLVSGKSSTANIKVIGAPAVIFTRPQTGWLAPATAGRTLVVDASGLADANMVKAGPTGSGTAQTARDIGASVLLSTGTGTGQLDFTSGVVKANATQLLGTAWLTPGTAGTPDVNVKLWNALTTVALPLVPTVAGRTLDVSAGGEAGLDWANIGSPTTSNGLTGTTIATSQVVASVSGAVGSVTGAVGSVTGAVGSVTGNVGGNVVGSVASVTGAVGSVTGLTASDVGAIKTKTDSLTFTVANKVDANIRSVNSVTVTGVGTVGSPWGP